MTLRLVVAWRRQSLSRPVLVVLSCSSALELVAPRRSGLFEGGQMDRARPVSARPKGAEVEVPLPFIERRTGHTRGVTDQDRWFRRGALRGTEPSSLRSLPLLRVGTRRSG